MNNAAKTSLPRVNPHLLPDRQRLVQIIGDNFAGDQLSADAESVLYFTTSSRLQDYKLTSIGGKCHLMLTEVDIALRFQSSQETIDLDQIEPMLAQLKLAYLTYRLAKLNEIHGKIQNSCRSDGLDVMLRGMQETAETVHFDFVQCCNRFATVECTGYDPRASFIDHQRESSVAVFSNFSLENLLQLVLCLIQQRKIVVTSENQHRLSRMQAALEEVIFKNLGVPWPHIVACFLPLQSEASKDCSSCLDWSQGLF